MRRFWKCFTADEAASETRACAPGDHPEGAGTDLYFPSEPGDPAAAARLAEGEVLAQRFQVRRLLHEGSNGAMYLFRDALVGHEVAGKVLVASLCEDRSLIQGFVDKAAVLSRINDRRHVLQIYDVHQVARGGDDLLLMTMEYVENCDLRLWENAHRGDVDVRRSKGYQYVLQACEGLLRMHEQGVVHGKLQPESVVLVGGVAKVGFLSTARDSCGAGSLNCDAVARALTPYSAPETAMATATSDVSPRRDVFALGVMLYEMLAADNMPPCLTEQGIPLHSRTSDTPPALDGVPEDVWRVISRCLDKHPLERFATAGAVLEALEDAVLEVSGNEGAGTSTGPEVATAWRKAQEHLGRAEMEEARAVCVEILERAPDHRYAQNLKEDIDRRYASAERLLDAIQSSLTTEGLAELVHMAHEAAALYPSHPRGQTVQIQLLARGRRYRGLLRDGVGALHASRWEHAVHCFTLAQEIDPSASAPRFWLAGLARLLERKGEIREQIDAAVQCGDFKNGRVLATMLDREEQRFRAVVAEHIGRTA